jgi:hypothetical protein
MDQELDNIVAFMVLESSATPYSDNLTQIVIYPFYSAETPRTTYAIKNLIQEGDFIDTQSSNTPVEWVEPKPNDEGAYITLKIGQALKSGFGLAHRMDTLFSSSGEKIRLSSKGVEKWNRAAAFINNYEGPNFQNRLPQALQKDHHGRYYPESRFENALEGISPNFPTFNMDGVWADIWGFSLFQYFSDLPAFGLVVTFLPLIYGGVHLVAWNFEFPTKTELLLWKIACVNIMATVPVVFLGSYFWEFLVPLFWIHWKLKLWKFTFLKLLAYPCFLFYALSRSYLVVESFISLRSIPIGVYWMPSWLQMLPHI